YILHDSPSILVSFGDIINIDTDHVIYIENCPNYHIYTFSIQRENPLPGDPLENLVLSPLPDGSYKELLVTYHLTTQEKALLTEGSFIIPHNKISVAESSSNFSNLFLQKSQDCVWTTVVVGYTTCSENVHSNGEGSSQCSADTRSQP